MTTIINLFGGPGVGKSTNAAGLFYEMKHQYKSVEMSLEYAKELTWDKRHNILTEDQVYIFAKQLRRLNRLKGQVDYIITDSPLLLGLAYVPESYPADFNRLVLHFWNEFNNINFLIRRTKMYVPVGRNQTEEEAKVIDVKVKGFLDRFNVDYEEIDYLDNVPKQIMDYLTRYEYGELKN